VLVADITGMQSPLDKSLSDWLGHLKPPPKTGRDTDRHVGLACKLANGSA
jgi:hypothetical protein